MPRNLYADLTDFKRWFTGVADATALADADAQEIEKALEAYSRATDACIRRQLFSQTATRVLDGNGCDRIRIPDLIAATSVKLDEDGNRTFELTLAANTDYYLKRYGADDEDDLPKTMLILDAVNGQRSYFAKRPRLIQIAGRWGYSEDTEDTLEDVPGAGWTAGGTTLALTASTSIAAGRFAVGQTLFVEAEQIYVRALVEATPDSLTVDRGVNGTGAVAHAATISILRFVYHPLARMAVLKQTARAWKRRESSFATGVTNPVTGSYESWRRLDPDIEADLAPLKRADRMVA